MIDIMYTLRTTDGEFEDASVRAEHVPRVGELVTFDQRTSYQVVDVLWSTGNGQQRAMITAYERDWHEHIGDVHRVWAQTSLPPADGRHVIELMQLIDWSRDDDGDSTIPDVLYHQLDNDRWIMLQNALIDWDLLLKNPSVDNDALFRLAVVYTLPVFEGASDEVDQALGQLLSTGLAAQPKCESAGAVAAFGRRWREDLCATAWRLVLAHRQRERA